MGKFRERSGQIWYKSQLQLDEDLPGPNVAINDHTVVIKRIAIFMETSGIWQILGSWRDSHSG